MKRGILLIAAVLLGWTSNAQVTAGSVTMGAGYADQVYYKMSNQATNAYAHSSWDVAFLRTGAFSLGTRINEARGIEVYEASANNADWATIDVSQLATWNRLYNSETEWEFGAVDFGSATYGWGEYNPGSHHVEGAVIFVLKYANGTFRKFKINDFFGGYTFTYATWDGAAWSADQTVTLPNSDNADRFFNYYSLENNASVIAEPATTDWDFIFTKYKTDYFGDGSFFQDVTGVLHRPDLTVAENLEPGGMGDTSNLVYSEDINTIGYDWKTFNMETFTYSVNSDKAFYVKNLDGIVHRLVFNTFAGSSTGIITFNHEDVTSQLGTENFGNNLSFGIYPNPSKDKKISIIYDLPTGRSDKNNVTIYNVTGAKVYERKLSGNAGFFNQQIDLGALNAGVYVLKFESGDYTTTKKIVLQ